MLRTITLLILLICIDNNYDYQKIFGNDYIEALNYLKEKKIVLKAYFKAEAIDNEIIIPVIFPERIRYSIIRDFIETSAVEMIYIKLGSDYVDFSIGDFQLKPSFAEKVEYCINESKELSAKYKILAIIKNKNELDIRKERIRRLKSLNYQLIYIAAFYDIVLKKFNINEKSIKEKIAFMAAAYNHGFDADKETLEKRIEDQFFPYGVKYKGKQYAYTDVAVDFYLNHYHLIFE